ncbi:NAD synthetase [Chitinispirillum alkaliphilum]|nr:NAD synthetase [Chitinispirillum alkaliphilum]
MSQETMQPESSSPEIRQITEKDLSIDAGGECERICSFIQKNMVEVFRKRGAVIGLSGGIDSSVTAALLAKALGKERVLGIFMPERQSSEDSKVLGQQIADHLGIETVTSDITPVLDAAGCYMYQNEAIRSVVPSYQPGCPFKIVLPKLGEKYRVFYIVIQMPDNSTIKERMNHQAYLQLVAATNFKQRTRKMIEYYHADRLNYAVAGSPNRLEFDQGFFVKNGDGSADLKPIAHLYKTQVYQLAQFLGIPEKIINQTPTTDTYPMEQTQEEFYFSLPYQFMDLCLFSKNNGFKPQSVCEATGLTPKQVQSVFDDIDAKRKTTKYGHMKPLLVEKINEIE